MATSKKKSGKTSNRGFASMDEETQRQISSKGVRPVMAAAVKNLLRSQQIREVTPLSALNYNFYCNTSF